MTKNIIVTCGTSIINNKTIHDPNFLRTAIDIDNNPTQFDEIYREITENINNVEIESLGAEINVLSKLKSEEIFDLENDRIFFFFSETKGGELLKKIFNETDILKNEIGDFRKTFLTISGFQTENKEVFQQKAISDFFQKLEKIKITDPEGQVETIMCPVGGYKALIPYSSLYAMVQGWDINYIYEDSDELMDLPSGMLSYLLIKGGIKDKDFQDIIEQLEKGENSIFSQDIKEFENIIKLIEATNRFIELGDLSGFDGIKFSDEKLSQVNDLLKKFVEFDTKIKFGQIRDKDEMKNIIEEIKKFTTDSETSSEGQKNVLSPIFDKLKEEFENFKLEDEIEYYFSILTFYKKHNMCLQGFLFMREFFIDLFVYLVGKNLKDNTDWGIGLNEIIEKTESLKVQKYKKEDNDTYSKISKKKPLFRELLSDEIIGNYFTDKDSKKNKKFIFKKTESRQINEEYLEIGNIITINLGNYAGEDKSDIKSMWNNIREIRNYFAHYKFSDNNKFSPENLKNTFKEFYNLLESFKNHILNNQTPN